MPGLNLSQTLQDTKCPVRVAVQHNGKCDFTVTFVCEELCEKEMVQVKAVDSIQALSRAVMQMRRA